jgi:hypothetical protein
MVNGEWFAVSRFSGFGVMGRCHQIGDSGCRTLLGALESPGCHPFIIVPVVQPFFLRPQKKACLNSMPFSLSL